MILWRHNPLHFYLWGSQHSELLGDGPISPGEEVAEKTRNPALGGSTLFHCTQLSTRTSSPLSWHLLSSPSHCPTTPSSELCYSSSTNSLKAMLHFHWVCFKAQSAARTTESSSGNAKNGRRAGWSTLVGEWNTSVLCVAPVRRDSAYTELGYFSWVHKVSWGHQREGKWHTASYPWGTWEEKERHKVSTLRIPSRTWYFKNDY